MLYLDDYLKLPYALEVIKDNSTEASGWFARVVELHGCMTQADTFEELDSMVLDAMTAWLETALEDGQPIPLPADSGRLVIQLPKSLHRELIEVAVREGVPVNTFVNAVLGQAVGQRQTMAS